MPGAPIGDASNRAVFDSDEVVRSYEEMHGLSPAETSVFDANVTAGSRVLDLGVGVGRTTPRLSASSSDYLGLDIAPHMVERAAALHPGQRFVVGDAADLSFHDDASVDLVVFSYNGLDYLVPEERREACLAEIARVLVDGGVLIFSSHDPRAVIRDPNRDLGAKAWPVAGLQTVRRLASRLRTRAFWSGAGLVFDPARGGLVTYMATPHRVIEQVSAHGFAHRTTTSSRHPARGRRLGTEWWYYVFERAPRRVDG